MGNHKYVTKIPDGDKVIGMSNFHGRIIIATEKRVYELINNVLYPVKVRYEDEER